jgi:hypothetical protein
MKYNCPLHKRIKIMNVTMIMITNIKRNIEINNNDYDDSSSSNSSSGSNNNNDDNTTNILVRVCTDLTSKSAVTRNVLY